MLPPKHLTGAQKRNKRKREEQLIESQKGALHNFFQATSNAEVTQDQRQEFGAEVDPNEGATEEQNLDDEANANEHTQAPEGETLQPSHDIETTNIDVQDDSLLSIFYPRTWGNLNNRKKRYLN